MSVLELKQTAVNKLWTLSISIYCRVVIHLAGYSSALCLFASGRYKLQSCGEQTVSFFSESDSSRMRLVRGLLSCCLSLGPCWGGGCGQRLPDRLAQHKPCDPFLFFFKYWLIYLEQLAFVACENVLSRSGAVQRKGLCVTERVVPSAARWHDPPPHLCPPTSVEEETLPGPRHRGKDWEENPLKCARREGRLGPRCVLKTAHMCYEAAVHLRN